MPVIKTNLKECPQKVYFVSKKCTANTFRTPFELNIILLHVIYAYFYVYIFSFPFSNYFFNFYFDLANIFVCRMERRATENRN